MLFLKFFQSFGPSTHPAKIWRALPRGHLRIKELHTFYFQLLCNPPAFHPLPRGHLRVRKLHTFNSENFGNPRAFPPPPRKNLTSLRGHLRLKKMHAFCFQNFGNPEAFPLPPRKNWRALPPEATCVSENCMHLVSKILAILQPFHPPRKNLASATAGAPACQKIAYILFPTFLQSPGPSTHPVKVWRALPRGHLRVRKLHTSCFQNFGSPPALPPTQ